MAGARKFQLHLVTEPRRGSPDLVEAVTRALQGGVDWVQLRDKGATALALHTQAVQLARLTQAHAARLSVNDRLDVALAVDADGVHLAGQSMPVAAAAALAKDKLLVGRSVHALDEALAAASSGADYLTFGHVFPTQSHPDLPPRGLAQLAEIVEAVEVPVLAIGGVTPENLPDVLATGCSGICVISAILAQADPCQAAARLRDRLDSSPHHPRRMFPNAAHREPTSV